MWSVYLPNSINQVEAYEYLVVYFYDTRQDAPCTELFMKMYLAKFAVAIERKLQDNFVDKNASDAMIIDFSTIPTTVSGTDSALSHTDCKILINTD